MALYWKAAAGILITVVLVLAVGKQEKDIALLLTMMACVMTSVAAYSFCEPILEFLSRIEQLGDLQSGILGTLLKITGIGLVSEMAAMICQDSGNGSLAKTMQLLGSTVILSLSIPIMETLLELIQTILGDL